MSGPEVQIMCTKCSVNEAVVVCHQCGMPLCLEEGCCHEIVDPLFNDAPPIITFWQQLKLDIRQYFSNIKYYFLGKEPPPQETIDGVTASHCSDCV